MSSHSYPSVRTLAAAWLVLMALTLATMVSGRVAVNAPPGIYLMAALLIVTGLKAVLILNVYLDLRSAASGWGKLFTGLVGTILTVVFVLYASTANGPSMTY